MRNADTIPKIESVLHHLDSVKHDVWKLHQGLDPLLNAAGDELRVAEVRIKEALKTLGWTPWRE